jgi:hypothetical protein
LFFDFGARRAAFTRIARMRDGKGPHLSRKGILALRGAAPDLFEWAARRALVDSSVARSVGGVALSATPFDHAALRVFLEGKSDLPASLDMWEQLRSVEIPWVGCLNVQQLLELRDEAGEALVRFRRRMMEELRGDLQDPGAADVVLALRVEANLLREELQRWGERGSARVLLKSGWLSTAALVFIGGMVLSGGGPADALASGVFGALCDLHARHGQARAEAQGLLARPAYVLLKAQELIHRHADGAG